MILSARIAHLSVKNARVQLSALPAEVIGKLLKIARVRMESTMILLQKTVRLVMILANFVTTWSAFNARRIGFLVIPIRRSAAVHQAQNTQRASLSVHLARES